MAGTGSERRVKDRLGRAARDWRAKAPSVKEGTGQDWQQRRGAEGQATSPRGAAALARHGADRRGLEVTV